MGTRRCTARAASRAQPPAPVLAGRGSNRPRGPSSPSIAGSSVMETSSVAVTLTAMAGPVVV